MKDFTNKNINANCLQGLQTLTGKMYFYEDGFSFKADSVNGVINKGKTLYKDIKLLEESYKVISLTPFNMFPKTKHIETVCLLEKE